MRLGHDTSQERRQWNGREQTWPSQERPGRSSTSVIVPGIRLPCGLAGPHLSRGSVSTSSLLLIKSDFPSQLTWSLSLAVRRRDSHREPNRRWEAHSPSFAVTSAQMLGCMPSGYGATRRYMQIGLHNNHTCVFLGKNKMECPSLGSNHRTSSYAPAMFFTISWLPYVHTFVFGLCSTNLAVFAHKVSDCCQDSKGILSKFPSWL